MSRLLELAEGGAPQTLLVEAAEGVGDHEEKMRVARFSMALRADELLIGVFAEAETRFTTIYLLLGPAIATSDQVGIATARKQYEKSFRPVFNTAMTFARNTLQHGTGPEREVGLPSELPEDAGTPKWDPRRPAEDK